MMRIQLRFIGFILGLGVALPGAHAASGKCGCDRLLDPNQTSACSPNGQAGHTRDFYDQLDRQRNQQLRSQAEEILRHQSGSTNNILWARGILRLPLHWNMIPPDLRTVPANLTELDAYLAWLEQVRFDLGNQLPGSRPTNRRLGGS